MPCSFFSFHVLELLLPLSFYISSLFFSLSCYYLGPSLFLLSLNSRWSYYCLGPSFFLFSSPQAQDNVALIYLFFSSPQTQVQNVVALVIFSLSPFLSLRYCCLGLSFSPLSSLQVTIVLVLLSHLLSFLRTTIALVFLSFSSPQA